MAAEIVGGEFSGVPAFSPFLRVSPLRPASRRARAREAKHVGGSSRLAAEIAGGELVSPLLRSLAN